MSQKYYDTAVFGATFLGLGAALGMDNVVVIEKGGLFGAEFVNSYKVCEKKVIEAKTSLGKDFLENLEKRGLVSTDGEIYPAPAVYVLSAYLKEKPFDILLMTEVTDIKKADDYYVIMVFHSNGFETIYAKHILDTTNLGIGHDKAKKHTIEKKLNTIMYNPSGAKLDGLSYNSQNALYTFTLPVEPHSSRYDAVELLCSMEKVFAEKQLQISSIASDFSYTMEPCTEVIEEQFIWIPSTAYANLVEAFEIGVQFAEEGRAWFYGK